jgi:hypothetical protein
MDLPAFWMQLLRLANEVPLHHAGDSLKLFEDLLLDLMIRRSEISDANLLALHHRVLVFRRGDGFLLLLKRALYSTSVFREVVQFVFA